MLLNSCNHSWVVSPCDIHVRFLNDYLNGLHEVRRSRSELFDYRGTVFTSDVDERHKVVESPRGVQHADGLQNTVFAKTF